MCQRTSTSKCLQFPALIPVPHTIYVSEPVLLGFHNMPFAQYCFFPCKTSKTGRPQPCNLQKLSARSSIKWFLTDESPPFPCPKPHTKTREPFRWTPSLWTAEIFAATYQTKPKCMCTHTKVFSKPSVDIYCFPSPQLAVKHLIQQLWPRASSALRTLSATSLGQDTKKNPAGDLNDLLWCILHLKFPFHSC